MSLYKAIDLEQNLSSRIEDVYQNLIDLDQSLSQLNELKKLYENQRSSSQELIPILKRASSEWQNQRRWFQAEPIEEFLLQTISEKGDISEIQATLLSLLSCLEKQLQPQSLRKVVELSEKYIIQDNCTPFQIILLHKLINSLLNLYGVNKQSLNYHLSYEKLALECCKLLFSSSIDSGFYRVIWVGISSFYFFDRPYKNNTIRQTLAKLGLRSVQSVFTPETEIYRNKIHKRLSDRVHHELTPRLKIGYMTDFLYQHSIGWL